MTDVIAPARSLFAGLKAQAPDPLLSLIALYKNDPRAQKLDLGVGDLARRAPTGHPEENEAGPPSHTRNTSSFETTGAAGSRPASRCESSADRTWGTDRSRES